MVRKLVCALAVAALAAVSGSAQETTAAQVTKNPCVLSVNHDNQSVHATAKCRDGKRKLSVRWAYSYRYYDASGDTCGDAETGPRPSFSVPAGAASAIYTVTAISKVKVKGRYLRRTFHGRLAPGGNDYECGKLGTVQLPSASAVCSWDASSIFVDPPNGTCGGPTPLVAWSSPITKNGNSVSLGSVATRGGDCFLTPDQVGSWPAAASTNWLGYHIVGENLKCSDGVVAWIGDINLGLTNPAGKFCINHVFARAWNFQIPPTWGGKLYVVAFVQAGYDYRSDNPLKGVTFERTTAVFDLPGTEDGCPALMQGS